MNKFSLLLVTVLASSFSFSAMASDSQNSNYAYSSQPSRKTTDDFSKTYHADMKDWNIFLETQADQTRK